MLLAGFAALALSGCVLGPAYQRPKVPLPQTWPASAGTASDVVNTAWWKGFRDPELDSLIKQAIDANKDLLQATERVTEFEARLEIAGADRFPQVSYNLSASRSHYSTERPVVAGIRETPTQNAFEIGTNMNWGLDLWGKVRRADEAARADLLSSEYARHAVMLAVVTNVASSYFQLLALDQQLRLSGETLNNRTKALRLVETRYKGGSSSKLAMLQAKAAAEEVWVTIPDLQRQITTLENALSLLVGRNPGTIARRMGNEPVLPPIPGGVPSDILSRRPDVLEAEQNLVAANARIGIAKAAFFPSISLTGLLGFASNDLDTIASGHAEEASMGAGLLGPIFSGGKLSGQVREAEAYKRELLIKYAQSVQTALGDVDNALAFNTKANEIATRGAQQVKTLGELAQLADVRYQGGQSDYLEVLTAERDLYSAQEQQIDRDRDRYLALVSVYAAMGGGWMVRQDKLRAAASRKITSAALPAAASSTAAHPTSKEPPAAAAQVIGAHGGSPPAKVSSQEALQ